MKRTIFNVLSWEERCCPALANAFEQHNWDCVICFIDRRYRERTNRNRLSITDLVKNRGATIDFVEFDFDDSISSYHTIRQQLDAIVSRDTSAVGFDISTAPRNIIWMTLAALQTHYSIIEIHYTSAETYGIWQTKEDKEPKLILNRSGIMYPDKPTCLIILAGWDLTRAERVFFRFEPRKALIFRDVHASHYGNVQDLELSFQSITSLIDFDNKDLSDSNIRSMIEHVKPFVEDFNIICCSFGPKLGAVMLYRLVATYESIGLAYVPAGEHNPEVSTGRGYSLNFRLCSDCLVRYG